MKVRQDVALLGNDLAPTSWAIANSLYVYPLGAIVQRDAGVVTGNTIPVHTGHTFADLDKVYLYRQGQEGRIIATCTGAQLNRELTLDAVVQVLGGDILVNLGQDTTPDPALPAFNGSRAPIYADPDGEIPYGNSRVTTGPFGQFIYYHEQDGWWELLLDAASKIIHVQQNGTVVQP